MPDVKKEIISYQQYNIRIHQLCEKLESLKPNVIIAIPRGGLAIGLHISHYLDCDNLFTMPINEEVIQVLSRQFENSNILIVDDVCDSGETLKYIVNLFNNYDITNIKTATIHVKPRRSFQPDFYVTEVPDNCWLVYPWEFDTDPDKEYMK